MTTSIYINDEPSHEDYLERHLFADALVDLAATCDPPMAIGLYGTWGVGKTSFMKQSKGPINHTFTIGENFAMVSLTRRRMN